MHSALLLAEAVFYLVVVVSIADALVQIWRRRRAGRTMVSL